MISTDQIYPEYCSIDSSLHRALAAKIQSCRTLEGTILTTLRDMMHHTIFFAQSVVYKSLELEKHSSQALNWIGSRVVGI